MKKTAMLFWSTLAVVFQIFLDKFVVSNPVGYEFFPRLLVPGALAITIALSLMLFVNGRKLAWVLVLRYGVQVFTCFTGVFVLARYWLIRYSEIILKVIEDNTAGKTGFVLATIFSNQSAIACGLGLMLAFLMLPVTSEKLA